MNKQHENGQLPEDPKRVERTIDTLLDNRSEEFKAKVLQLAYDNGWDDSDPAFAIQVSVNQMQVLLEEYPNEFAVLLTGILEDAESRWATMQEGMIKAIKMAEMTNQTFEGYVGKLETATDKQVTLLGAESEKLIAKGFALSQAHAVRQIEAIAKGTQRIHYMKAAGYTCLSAIILTSLGWTGGWLSRGSQEQASSWGYIQQWNKDELKACIEDNQPTCSFHIKPPEEKTE